MLGRHALLGLKLAAGAASLALLFVSLDIYTALFTYDFLNCLESLRFG